LFTDPEVFVALDALKKLTFRESICGQKKRFFSGNKVMAAKRTSLGDRYLRPPVFFSKGRPSSFFAHGLISAGRAANPLVRRV
jgi:hypothetical protein